MRTLKYAPRNRAGQMAGLSLVELMVGIVVGLFVVAAATLLTSSQLSDNRRLLLETQVQQDLRATMDLVVRDTRRAGYSDFASRFVPAPATATTPSTIIANPTAYLVLPTGGTVGPLYYNYARADGIASMGFLLSGGVLKGCVGDLQPAPSGCASGWQDISDSNTLVITEFRVEATRSAGRSRPGNLQKMQMACPNLCDPDPTSAAATACWPSVQMRELAFTLKGHSKTEPSIERTITSSVRLRNLNFNVDASVPTGEVCPPAP